MESDASQSLTDRYDALTIGMPSRYDRVTITGTLPGVCHADGMTGISTPMGSASSTTPNSRSDFGTGFGDPPRSRGTSRVQSSLCDPSAHAGPDGIFGRDIGENQTLRDGRSRQGPPIDEEPSMWFLRLTLGGICARQQLDQSPERRQTRTASGIRASCESKTVASYKVAPMGMNLAISRLGACLLVFLAGACATSGNAPFGRHESDGVLYDQFTSGQVVLDCKALCQIPWQADAPFLFGLFVVKKWKDLALGVTRSNYHYDLAYYYLGRAAEALGFSDAAEAYYTQGLQVERKSKCATGGMCPGFNIPDDINLHLAVVRPIVARKRAEQAVEQAGPQVELARQPAEVEAPRQAQPPARRRATRPVVAGRVSLPAGGSNSPSPQPPVELPPPR
jgi:hypothetical protein